jgi:hypothetical protein
MDTELAPATRPHPKTVCSSRSVGELTGSMIGGSPRHEVGDAGGVWVGVAVAVGVGVNVAVSPGVDGRVGVSVGGGVGVSVDGGVSEGDGVGGPLRTSAKLRVGWLRSSVMLTGSDWLTYPFADTSRLST